MEDHVARRTDQQAHTGPRKYMSKGRRACDLCRSRKSACQIEVAPPCRMCRAHGQQCEFTNRVVRKKRPAPHSVAEEGGNAPVWHPEVRPAQSDTEQLSWPQGLNFLSMPENNLASASPSNMQGHVFGGPGLSHTSNEQLTPGFLSGPENADQFMIDDFMLSIYEGRTLPDVYQGTGSGLNSLDYSPLTSQVCGLTGDQDPYVLRHYQYDEKSEFVFSKLAIRKVQDGPVPVQFLLSKPELSADSRSQTVLRHGPQTNETPSLSEIVPPEVAERLIELFFRFVNPQFPVLSEANRPCPRTSPTHLLAAIYSITQPFTVFDDKLSIELAYNHPSPQSLSNIAWRSLNDEIPEPTIHSLQAALIMLLQPPSNPLLLESPLKWALLGLTVSMAQTLGLYLDPTAWNLPPEEVESRKRLAWLVWAADKWCAFSLGRPSHISRNDWMIIELDIEQNHSLPDAADQSSRFYTTQFSKLTLILDSVLADLYQDFKLAITTAQPILQRLDEWHNSLPSILEIRRGNDGNNTDLPNGSASLHIAYHAVKILVFRALLRPFNQPNNPDSTTTQDHQSHADDWLAAKMRIRNGALAEVTSVLSLISSFRQEHYQAFWAPWSKTSFALVTNLLFLLSATSNRDTRTAAELSSSSSPSPSLSSPSPGMAGRDEYAECRQALERARTIFRLHAKALDMMRLALLRIDAIFWIGWERVLGFK
ncbi:hypothetical protein UA08_07469 [Talaromyces atroroseus]|uniref:Zn(2)-C6 fungal-type domain-containing protein n=1 Tax=Talaromyces atroroseus TaxID=1441469 RepID=A0A225ASC4_TALAT|nr:hypothetical protein UA08_07469 [Talaromyces atroroseus]OKL57325.1 hypothetical protein UA08_07469 [Talaromyces atroroseus]